MEVVDGIDDQVDNVIGQDIDLDRDVEPDGVYTIMVHQIDTETEQSQSITEGAVMVGVRRDQNEGTVHSELVSNADLVNDIIDYELGVVEGRTFGLNEVLVSVDVVVDAGGDDHGERHGDTASFLQDNARLKSQSSQSE